MKFEPAELDGVSDNVNAVVEASPLNVCNFEINLFHLVELIIEFFQDIQ